MIECSNERILKKKKIIKNRKFFKFFVFFLILILLFTYYKTAISNTLTSVCGDYAYSYCTWAVNESVGESLSDGLRYSDLITVEKDKEGNITLINTNSYKINVISKDIAESTRKNLNNKLKAGVPISALAFSGIGLLSGYGDILYFKFISVSSVNCDFLSEFKSVGINQTLHSLYMLIETKVNIEIPLNKKEKNYSTSVLISETVLVGKIPDIYLNGNLSKL